jgi:BirA family transcriptional regulator, biotin operon repressor / biotin---[acetyl-CoA-carboxylase] ligase
LIETVATTGSTNADLFARLRAGEAIPEGTWLRAETQTGGKGRGGRTWISPPGNLYASTVIQLAERDLPPQTLALAIGLAVQTHVVGALMVGDHAAVSLKWPNDVLVRGAKVAGILLERCGDAIVAGIGINLAFAPQIEGRSTTCITALNPKYEADPAYALTFLVPRVAEQLARWRQDGLPALISRWSRAAHPIGSPLSVNGGDGAMLSGTFAGLDPNGALLLRLANGAVQTIHAGDVSLIAEGRT